MAEISFDDCKQAIGDLYLELWMARRDNQRLRETSAHLLEATRSQAAPPADAEDGPSPLPPTAIRKTQGG